VFPTGHSLVETLTVLLLAPRLLAIAALPEGAPMPEWHSSLAEHIVDGLGPGVTEGRSVMAAVTVTPLAERACIAK
jgi:hypothetical protein